LNALAGPLRAAQRTPGLERHEIRRTESHITGSTGHLLFRRAWLPEIPERIVVLVHGYAEHSGRYEHVGSQLANAGFAVHAYDQQGHGKSGGVRCHVRRFEHLLDDLEGFLATVRAEHASLPLFVVGHSMGGLVVAAYASQRTPDVAGVVTSGAALALPEDISRGRILCARLLRWPAPRLSLPSGLDPESLSRDPAVVRAYLEDPLVHQRMTTSLACEMFAAMERTASAAAQVRVPILLLHGEEDRLCPVSGSRNFFDRLTVSSRRLRIYPGLRHEIFNEPESVSVLDDLIDWIGNIEPGV
jgi:alpha-beta hydrolase superfamily lysophospholipase